MTVGWLGIGADHSSGLNGLGQIITALIASALSTLIITSGGINDD
jgi:hypothetical protein